MEELPNTVNFEAFQAVVTEDQVVEKVPCGPNLDKIAEGIKQFVDAGYTEVALV